MKQMMQSGSVAPLQCAIDGFWLSEVIEGQAKEVREDEANMFQTIGGVVVSSNGMRLAMTVAIVFPARISQDVRQNPLKYLPSDQHISQHCDSGCARSKLDRLVV